MIRVIDGVRETLAPGAMAEFPVGIPGVFETILLRNGAPLLWAAHWARFTAGCSAFDIEVPVAEQEMAAAVTDVIGANAVRDGVVRFAAWRLERRVGWQVDASPPRPHMRKPEFVAIWGDPVPMPDASAAFKHLSRFEWIAATRAAREAGFDEALLCDPHGRMVEGGVSNVFFVRGGTLCTPSLGCRPLPGIMRERVIEHAREAGLPVEEGDYTPHDLARASEVWLTNSLIGVRPVREVAGAAGFPAWREPAGGRPRLQAFRQSWNDHFGWDVVVVV